MYTIENFTKGLTLFFHRTTVENIDNKIKLSRNFYHTNDMAFCEFLIDDIQAHLSSLSNSTINDDFILTDGQYFEVPVRAQESSRMPYYRSFDNGDFLEEKYSYTFNINKLSSNFFVALMCYLAENSDKKLETMYLRQRTTQVGIIESIENMCEMLPIITVKISSPSECSQAEFLDLFKSYTFNIAYVNNIVFTKTNLLEIPRNRRNSLSRNGQLFPYKKHKDELLKYYYQGLSTDIPFAQYLAFYHVAEFYFQTIAEDDAFQLIEKLITHPSFSPHRKKDIKEFYNKIKRKMSEQNDEGVWKEKVGLRLCLEKYIPDIETLKKSIISIDPNAISYYNSNDVPFASESSDNSIRINFEDKSSVYANICNRVYLVRNAIAHSKEGDHLRYEPFSHDAELAKEIPLMRSIAEEIIINSAKDSKIKYGEDIQ